MPTTPSSLAFVEEVQTSTIGDQVTAPAAGSLGLFSNQNGQWYSKNNTGVITALSQIPTPPNYAATAIPLTTVTNVDSRGGLLFPANDLPCSVRITIQATNAATAQTLTATVRFGTTNTSSDTAILTQAFTAGTAAVGSGMFVFEIDLATATTMRAAMRFFNGNNAATGIAGVTSLFAGLSAAATVSTTSNSYLGVYFSSATAAAITIRSVKYEIVST